MTDPRWIIVALLCGAVVCFVLAAGLSAGLAGAFATAGVCLGLSVLVVAALFVD